MKQAINLLKNLWSKPNVKLTICVLGIIVAVSILMAAMPLAKQPSNVQKSGLSGISSVEALRFAKSSSGDATFSGSASQPGTVLAQAGSGAVQGSNPPLPNNPAQANNSPDVLPINNPSIVPKSRFVCIEPFMSNDGCFLRCPESFISCFPCRPPLQYPEATIMCAQ
jgi:hypothetical protein